MGFFKDFKRDFAQAVNELMPDKDELANEYDDEDMVNTFDEDDNMDIAPEDLLEDLDDFSIEASMNSETFKETEEKYEEEEEKEVEEESNDSFDQIPDAEIINESLESDTEGLVDKTFADSVMVEMVAETENNVAEDDLEDELLAVDELDEENMEENTDDAFLAESEEPYKEELVDVDLNKAVEAAILKHDEDAYEEDNMAELNKSDYMDKDIISKEAEVDNILSDDTTYITKGTTIKGDVETDGGIDVIGAVLGNVTCAGKLIVGGSIKGNVSAGEVYSNAAKIEGEITSTGSVKIGVGSVVVGNVNATSAVVAGAVNGDIDVHGPVIVDSTAVIMGNIKSRSVQINNGAVIEGFCSQCYSEIDVKSFFE